MVKTLEHRVVTLTLTCNQHMGGYGFRVWSLSFRVEGPSLFKGRWQLKCPLSGSMLVLREGKPRKS